MQIAVKTSNNSILIVFQHQSKVSASLASGDLLTTSACIGADTLLKLLGNYCRNKDIKTAITVGIVGMLMLLLLIFVACIGQPPISAFISQLEVICLLVVPRPRCVESLRIGTFIAFVEYVVHLSSLDANGIFLLKP